ncbi:MAG: hypothetical protein MMC23_009489 [Stictis urceolatum]|nr:hypothetical protein [Stictis urceolata]
MFRTRPKKPLSVTDLISPSWCELQYWYTLSKHGRKRRTAAMRQGSKVHRALEDQVHRTVEISVKGKEDAFALRIINVMQGLHTMQRTGMTRELEVWGVLNGEVVNGVIDELSYMCPDKDLEDSGLPSTSQDTDLRPGSGTVSTSCTTPERAHGGLKSLDSMRKHTSRVYLSDVKTRGHKSIPRGASFRPTLYQLMLYRVLLSALVENDISFEVIAARYELDANRNFSDTFLAQIGRLDHSHHEIKLDNEEKPAAAATTKDLLDVLLSNNSLSNLWKSMIELFQLVMPEGRQSIGSVLKAEYRDRNDGSILGMKTFLHDERLISTYVRDGMEWWKGHREPQGVCIEEAFKCRSCDFRDECEWRLSKAEEATQKYRSRTRSVV